MTTITTFHIFPFFDENPFAGRDDEEDLSFLAADLSSDFEFVNEESGRDSEHESIEAD